MKKGYKVFIATSSFSKVSNKPISLLENSGLAYEVNKSGRKLKPSEIQELLTNCDGVIAGTEEYSKETLALLPRLKVISRLGVGTDNIDLDAAKERNIIVKKSTTTPALAVAELALLMFLNLSRKIIPMNNLVKNGNWEKQMGNLVSGKILGIIGLGKIGKKLVEITQGFNLEYLAFDKYKDNEFAKEHKVNYVDLNDLMRSSDLISIHLNASSENHTIINYEKFELMTKKPMLVNTSRGEVINESDLIKALENKLLSGAGLDVFQTEPYSGKLKEFENVITTPHIGSYASEIRNQMEIESVENIIKGVDCDKEE